MNIPLKCRAFAEYELIDCGNNYKMERFGDYILSRPEPQAIWSISQKEDQWMQGVHIHFERDKVNPEKGNWLKKKQMPDQWKVNHEYKNMKLVFRLGTTSFKHIGIFPEQAENWNYIFDKVNELKKDKFEVKVLNLFAYTGGASLAAKAAGADVVHVDSVKQVVTWSKENMELSGLDGIRWVVEDAMKFVKREQKRGSLYQGIILDPPAYGRGPDGEKWVIEDDLDEMLEICSHLLDNKNGFLILNLYSMGYSPIIAQTLVKSHFGHEINLEFGEMYFEDKYKKQMPLGIYARFKV
ncbi:MAG: class I SAM-dependent methyltransferase [Cytophagales bacterium]